MRKAQALLLHSLRTRRPGRRLAARLRAWVGAPRRRSPLRYLAAAWVAPWAPRPRGAGAPPHDLGVASPARAPRSRRPRPTRRPMRAALRLALAGAGGGLGTPAPLGLPRRWAPSPLGALAWAPFKRR